METNDKPNPTDPSAGAGTPPAAEELPIEEVVRRGVKAAIEEQMKGTSPVTPQPPTAPEPPKPPQGGTGSDVTPGKDSSGGTDPAMEVLKLVEASTGRKFDNVDDAKKYLTNLNSLVGDQAVAKTREEAKLFSTFIDKWAQSQGQSAEEAKRYWADQLIGKATTPAPAAVPTPKVP